MASRLTFSRLSGYTARVGRVAIPRMNRGFSTSMAARTAADPKVEEIVESISKLTLLQTADLIQGLKTKLNISEVAMPVAAAAPAAGAAAPEEKVEEKTEFKVKLDKFDAASKAKIIREIKGLIPGINLVEAKKFVESAPKVIKESVSKEEAEKIKATLEGLGATVTLE